MKAKVSVKLKPGVLDPQGVAVLHAAHSLGFEEVKDVRVGKIFEIELGKGGAKNSKEILDQLSDKLLANTVIEKFEVELIK